MSSHLGDSELSDGPLRQDGLGQPLDHQVPVVERLWVRGPVLVTLHLRAHTQVKYTRVHTCQRQLTEATSSESSYSPSPSPHTGLP